MYRNMEKMRQYPHHIYYYVHKEKVDNLNIIDTANEFGCANESRLSTFGKFSEDDFQTRSDNCN